MNATTVKEQEKNTKMPPINLLNVNQVGMIYQWYALKQIKEGISGKENTSIS